MQNVTTPRLRNRRRLGWPILTSLFFLLLAGCPEPDPDPPPPPPPPPPITALRVVLLYESDQVDDLPWLANILTSQKIRRLESKDVDLVIADEDELDENAETPAVIWPWVDMTAKDGLTLPQIFFVDQDGELIHNEPLPQQVDAVVALIKERLP